MRISSCNVGVVLVALMIYAYPFEIYSLEINTVRIRPIDFVSFIAVFYFLLFFISGVKKLPIDTIGIALLVYVFAGLLSISNAPNFSSLIGVLYFILIFFVYIFTRYSVHFYSDIELIVKAILFISVIVALYVLYEFFMYLLLGEKVQPFFWGMPIF